MTAFGQIPVNTVFFDYDFTAADQITAKFGDPTIEGGDAAGQPADNGGIFVDAPVNRGPFVDGSLGTQVGFNNGPIFANMVVDTAGGFAMETATSPTNYFTGNLFVGQPKLVVDDTVRLISELSFTKALIEDAENPGTFVEANSAFDNHFFGFRGGIGTTEFAPNDGISQAFRYNIGADNTIDSDSNIQVFANTNATSSAGGTGDGNIAFGAVSSLGIDIANSDFETDIFRIVIDAVVTATSASSGITFEVTTSIEDASGTVLGATPAATTATDTSITLADDRIQFAIRDGNSGPNDPTNLEIHRVAAIFNPDDSAFELGDFDMDVDLVDLDQYNGNIGAAATGALEDLDGNGTIDAADFQQHYTDLVETSNGQKGTFAGDVLSP